MPSTNEWTHDIGLWSRMFESKCWFRFKSQVFMWDGVRSVWIPIFVVYLKLGSHDMGTCWSFLLAQIFLKMVHFLACHKTKDVSVEANFYFEDVVRWHGVPKKNISDRDSKFLIYFWNTLWRKIDFFHPILMMMAFLNWGKFILKGRGWCKFGWRSSNVYFSIRTQLGLMVKSNGKWRNQFQNQIKGIDGEALRPVPNRHNALESELLIYGAIGWDIVNGSKHEIRAHWSHFKWLITNGMVATGCERSQSFAFVWWSLRCDSY